MSVTGRGSTGRAAGDSLRRCADRLDDSTSLSEMGAEKENSMGTFLGIWKEKNARIPGDLREEFLNLCMIVVVLIVPVRANQKER